MAAILFVKSCKVTKKLVSKFINNLVGNNICKHNMKVLNS